MRQIQSPSSVWKDVGGWVAIGASGLILWSFRGFFSTVGDTAAAKAAAAMAKAQADARLATDRAAVKASLGTNYIASEAEIATWRADAATLMAYFDSTSSISFQRQQGEAFSLLKQKYPRLFLWNNKPFAWYDGNHNKRTTQKSENVSSVRNPTYWKVLVPFYKELTNGRDLLKDIHLFIYDDDKKALFKWIL